MAVSNRVTHLLRLVVAHRWLLAALVLLLSAVGQPHRVTAHANLVQSDPPTQAVLAKAPDRVQVSFSEPVEPRDIELLVLDAQRQQVDQRDPALLPGTPDTV